MLKDKWAEPQKHNEQELPCPPPGEQYWRARRSQALTRANCRRP
jgi:hypothetical protein